MTNDEMIKLYQAAYKQANAPMGGTVAKPVPWRDRIRAFLSRRPANVINAAGNKANPGVYHANAPANGIQLRNQLLAGN